MWKNWFSAYRSDDEPGSVRENLDDEYSPEDRSRRKKIIAAILAGVALLLLILLLCLVLLLTTHESQPIKTGKDSYLRSRKLGQLGRKVGKSEPESRDICIRSPPRLAAMISSWDRKSRGDGTAISYWCDGDPEKEQMLLVVCINQIWQTVYDKQVNCRNLLEKRHCLGDPIPPTDKNPFDWDFESRDFGTRINYRCDAAEDAPIMRTLVCGNDYEWQVEADTITNCYCREPLRYVYPVKTVIEKWDGRDYKPGTTVKYSCSTAMGETHFQTLECQPTTKWTVTKTGSCFFLADESLNYTNAIDYCAEMGGKIVTINNNAEQDAIRSLLAEEKAFDSTCIHRAFLGIREDISKQWQTGDGTFVSGLSEMFFMVDEGSEKCAAIQRPGYFKLNNVQCSGTSYCQICEYYKNSTTVNCTNAGAKCYMPKTMRGDYEFSKKECENEGGRLARISSVMDLEEIRDLLGKDAHYSENCISGFYVDLRSDQRYYKTFDGEDVGFTMFTHDSRRSMDRHCVVIHELQRFQWVDQECSVPACVLCKMAGFPVGSVAPDSKLFQPKQNLTSDRADHTPPVEVAACDPGWVTDGFHCYIFNNTLVTNAEARAICRNNFGSLASLISPFERNFIVDHLITLANTTTHDANRTDPSIWYVESTGGLPSGSDDDIGYPTNLGGSVMQCVSVHVKPTVGWAVIDCDTKAGFICHD